MYFTQIESNERKKKMEKERKKHQKVKTSNAVVTHTQNSALGT